MAEYRIKLVIEYADAEEVKITRSMNPVYATESSIQIGHVCDILQNTLNNKVASIRPFLK